LLSEFAGSPEQSSRQSHALDTIAR
jgi:hypothetical protein